MNKWVTVALVLALLVSGCTKEESAQGADSKPISRYKKNTIIANTIKNQQCNHKDELLTAIANGDQTAVTVLVSDYQCYIDEANLTGVAMVLNNMAMIEFFNGKVDDKHSLMPAITIAGRLRSLEYASFLVNRGADINRADVHENTLAKSSVCDSQQIENGSSVQEMLEFVVARGGDVTRGDDRGETPLHCATDSAMVELLLANGAAIDAVTDENWSALHRAANNHRQETAAALIRHGAKLNLQENYHGYSALHMAVDMKNYDMAKLLLDSGIDAGLKDQDGKTALMLAQSKDEPDAAMIKLLSSKTGS